MLTHSLLQYVVLHTRACITAPCHEHLCECFAYAAVYWIACSSCMLVQEEYAAEGIDWSYVEFIDNQDCLDLLEGSPVNPALAVFPLIDEACRMPRATYQVSCSTRLPLAST